MTASEALRHNAELASRDDDSSISKTVPAWVPPAIDAQDKRGVDAGPLLGRQIKRAIRRTHLRQIVPLADTTIYEMEQRDEFPRRFYLTPRCVAWDLAEVEAWVEDRRRASYAAAITRAPSPDVRQRKARPVRK